MRRVVWCVFTKCSHCLTIIVFSKTNFDKSGWKIYVDHCIDILTWAAWHHVSLGQCDCYWTTKCFISMTTHTSFLQQGFPLFSCWEKTWFQLDLFKSKPWVIWCWCEECQMAGHHASQRWKHGKGRSSISSAASRCKNSADPTTI